jgi:Flp pilus assembly protein TadG
MRLIRKFIKNRTGSAAIEFALLALPFMVVVFSIVEVALMFFIDSALDAALHKTVRKIRTGTAMSQAWDMAAFKNELCKNLAYSFSCGSTVLVRSQKVTAIDAISFATPVNSGKLEVTETFTLGASGDYILIQVFLPWDPIISFYAMSSSKLSDGTNVLGATVLFKNEPF